MQGHITLGAGRPGLHPRQCAGKSLIATRLNTRLVNSAMAGGMGGAQDDPYQVLGVRPNADSAAINKAYKKALADAKGDEERIRKIEEAHTSIFMSSFSAFKTGKVKIDRSVAKADRPVYFPWRPRFYKADQKLMIYAAIAQCLLLGYTAMIGAQSGAEPAITACVFGAFTNIVKLNQIEPPPSPSSEERNSNAMKHIVRGFILAFIATCIGCWLFYSLPDLIVSLFNSFMPVWFYEYQNVILTVGSCVANWYMSAFYR